MKHLKAINKYFWKYRVRFIVGILFVVTSNYFAVLAPQVTGYIVNQVQQRLPGARPVVRKEVHDALVNWFIRLMEPMQSDFSLLITICCLVILLLAVLRGLLMFFMRQTIIVMSRHIEFDQKNEIFQHYELLDTNFYKTNSTGDLMNRMAEDVSRVRMYTGPAIMYLINLIALITFCVVNMVRKDPMLTLYVLAPLPLLAFAIYVVNTIIHKKSEQIQGLLSDLTTNAQESYSGIRVIKSFVQEKAMQGFFERNSEDYKRNAIGLAKVEAVYFPSMALMIGLSTLITILIGGIQAIHDTSRVGIIVEFVIYINMLTFPVSAIGWVASMIQRASASQKRLNEFLQTVPVIQDNGSVEVLEGDILFKDVNFTYPHTGIKAVEDFNLHVKNGEKVLILGKTGSGKSTIAQLLLRFYEPSTGTITIGGRKLPEFQLRALRQQVSYVPQDVFLFSDSIENNISFGVREHTFDKVRQAAQRANIDKEIMQFPGEYNTLVGERGVTLSGGQKQRISIARALVKDPQIVVFDDCLSAVDTATENIIISNFYEYLREKTSIIITHRIFPVFEFDKIIILEDGHIAEQGTHQELMKSNGYYAELYRTQVMSPQQEEVVE
ncbi:ABC transporter ATP-binding protein [Segetibacter sp. 3557_3]|uniref:ABC transporter ATP-binding protein n=1 Tax=Segetibacter sp. 3557_3 TaxID=2547429 RepID=UPI001058CF48|nr:ABC transporter ATP-binding protein [Segetibacter sp. 3557_3]TDH29169.1 ABC transporter ATP-binding protein [Segetibacter sp. 3557_3]